jgi:transcriptional regulator with XRE-family HTH domain
VTYEISELKAFNFSSWTLARHKQRILFSDGKFPRAWLWWSAMEIGRRIRKLRTQQGRTLKGVADECGFTEGLLSKIETGKTVPPVATLSNIAQALRVPLASLVDDRAGATTVFVPREAAGKASDKGYLFMPLATERVNKAMQPIVFEAQRGKVKREVLQHRGEEYIYMLEGEMKFRVGSTEYRLRPGDSLYFDSDEPHDLEPVTAKIKCLTIWFTPPAAAKAKAKTKNR